VKDLSQNVLRITSKDPPFGTDEPFTQPPCNTQLPPPFYNHHCRPPPPPPTTRLIPTDHRNDARTRRSPSGNLRATTTDTFVFLSLPPLPSLGRSPPSHRPLDPIATSPLDPSIALSLVLPPSASLPPHPSTPRHLAPSTSRPPRPHSHHCSLILSARRPLHSRPLTNRTEEIKPTVGLVDRTLSERRPLTHDPPPPTNPFRQRHPG
jgi:hypothetical protein